MSVYLALRHAPPPGFFPKLFFHITKARLLTRYPHGGVVVDGVLYQSTVVGGTHSLNFVTDGWDLFKTDIDSAIVMRRFDAVKDSKYDWFSLMGFVLPWRVSKASWFYCYELSQYLLTGVLPTGRVTPESLLAEVYREQEQTSAI